MANVRDNDMTPTERDRSVDSGSVEGGGTMRSDPADEKHDGGDAAQDASVVVEAAVPTLERSSDPDEANGKIAATADRRSGPVSRLAARLSPER
ncbi:MAG: hypothetical protein JXB46_06370, partial [Candidatus Eisenbacteria bacterium]|nr:hypothetical protein [Candidatus Eisenbacteria bacterium]